MGDGSRIGDGDDLAAIVLAGGRARRLGGDMKPARVVGGTPLLVRVLEAVRGAGSRVVVGPDELDGLLPAGVLRTLEEPPGAGPVAAIAAGLAVLPARPDVVAVLGGDLPFVDEATLWTVREALTTSAAEAAVAVDETGRPQWMLAMWRAVVLERRIGALGTSGGLDGRGMRELAAGVRIAEVRLAELHQAEAPPPWFDCDTEDDLRRAEEWARGNAG